MTAKPALTAAVLSLLIAGAVPPSSGRAEESDTARVTRELDRYRQDKARVLLRRDQARDSALTRQRSRGDARRRADSLRRDRLSAEPSNRLTDRLYLRPEPLGTAARPR